MPVFHSRSAEHVQDGPCHEALVPFIAIRVSRASYDHLGGQAHLNTSSIWPFVTFAVVPVTTWLVAKQVSHIHAGWLRNSATTSAYFFAISSTLLLVLSLPTGSIDVTDLWSFLLFALLPSIPLLAITHSSSIKVGWIRTLLRTVSSLLIIPAALLFLMLCLAQSACVRRNSPIYSPDGKHLALVQFVGQGALGDDYGSVYVRRSWLPIRATVYEGLGAWDSKHHQVGGPEVRWLDSSHLMIRYWDDRAIGDGRGAPAICKGEVGLIKIVCVNENPPGLPRK